MRTLYATIAIVAVALIFIASTEAYSQKQPIVQGTNLKPGGVSSRNMELLDIVSLSPAWHDQFETITVTFPVGSTSVTKHLIVAPKKETSDGANDGLIHLVDVTDPRNVNPNFLKLLSKGTSSSPTDGNIDFEYYQVYKDQNSPESGTYKGDVFLIAWVEDVRVTPTEATTQVNARFMVFNLTKACELRASGSSNTITVDDASKREVTSTNSSTKSPHVYLGYVTIDKQWRELHWQWKMQKPHGLTVDAEAGLLIMTPNKPSAQFTSTTTWNNSTFDNTVIKSHIDCFDLTKLTDIFLPSQTTLEVLPRITQSGSTGPIELWYMGSNGELPLARDVYAKKLGTGKVRLVIASTSGAENPVFEWNLVSGVFQNSLSYFSFGGVLTADLDYSTSNNATYSNKRDWQYDSDRDEPLSRTSPLSNWGYRVCHTAIPFWHTNGTPYVLTADELSGSKSNPIDPNNYVTPYLNRIVAVSGKYEGGIEKAFIAPSIQDDRRIGAFTRIWKAEEGSTSGLEIKSGQSSGANNGALTYYDPIQVDDAIVPDDLYYGARRTANSSSSRIESTAAFGPASTNKLGPVTVHRPYVIMPYEDRYDTSYNNNDVFVSNYAQGVRVVNLSNIASSPHPVLEKGFFDFIPRLSYDGLDQYFYMLMPGGIAPYSSLIAFEDRFAFYWLGVSHSVPDFGPSRVGTNGSGTLPADEKFIYALAVGEGTLDDSVVIKDSLNNVLTTIPKDPSEIIAAGGRNWLPEGGFLVLRYFDGKLGGTIKGYEGTGSTPRKWSRRPYQTINLQGDFTVERDVTVAAGACVQLLPGHENDPGIFTDTRLLPPSSGDKTVYVDGVLNISIPEGDAIGTDIVIDVPIVVRDGGVLNIYNIRSGKKVMFKKKVIVQSGGTWKFHKSSNVELYYEDHEAHGKLIVDGDEDASVKITSRRNGTSYSKSAYIVGRGTTDNAKSLVSIEYADITNTYIDLDRITVNSSTFTITQSDFRTTRNAERGGLFLFKLTRPLSEYVSWGTFRRRQAKVRITNTDFTDALSGLPALQSIQFAAMVSDAASLYLTNVGLDKFLVGLFAKDNDGVYITDCQVTNSTMGVVAENGSSVICNTDFYNNEFSSTKYGTGSGQYKDNNYSVMKGGANIQNSGVQYFRNNEFSAYCYGVQSWGTTLFMRNEVRPGNDIEYGRNDFLVNTDQYGVWGCPTTDIGMARAAQLIVNCGYNQFSGASAYHVTGDNTCPAVDVSYNQWNPGAGYNPRFNNINWNGDNRNIQQDRDPDCGIVFNNLEVCNAPGLPPRGGEGYSELGFNDASLYTSASSVRTEVQDAGIGWRNRRDKAWEYFEIVSKIDSSTYQTVLKSDMQTILANTSLDSNLRSAALFIKASMHSARGEYDSAKTALSTLRSTYPLKSDSVPANWETMYINAITDTTGKVDSLIGVYLDRVLTDLRRKTTYGSTGLSKVNIDRDESVAGSGLVVSMNGPTHPNPSTTGRAVMTVSSNKSTKCFFDVLNVQGQVTDSFEYSLSSGENRVEINTEMFPPGTYTAQIRCDDSINRVSFVVTR